MSLLATNYEFTLKAAITVKNYAFQIWNFASHMSLKIQRFLPSSPHSSSHSLQIHTSPFSSSSTFVETFFSFLLSVLKIMLFHFPCPLITNHQFPLIFLAQFTFLFFSFLTSFVQHDNFL